MSSDYLPRIIIIGRPNVGKSTLFNKLARKKLAIVHDEPGVTRDWREEQISLPSSRKKVILIDTAGYEKTKDERAIANRVLVHTERVIETADLVLFVFDAIQGITPMDKFFADWARRHNKPTILLANKVDVKNTAQAVQEGFELGLGAPIGISAEHKLGHIELEEMILEKLEMLFPTAPAPILEEGEEGEENLEESEGEEETPRKLHLAIVGRPNVGKSTLINALLKDERVLTGPEPGLTRDSVALNWHYNGQDIKLIDTAGLRKRTKVFEYVEKVAASETQRAVRLAHVAILVIDATVGFDKQDMLIAQTVIEEGRCLIFALNKWDIARDPKEIIAEFEWQISHSLPQAKGVPFVTISALKGNNLIELLDKALNLYKLWNIRITTGVLNQWLAEMLERHSPPLVRGQRLKLRYMTQIKSRPPTFALWISIPDKLPDSYLKYLTSGLRESFGLPGVPIRILPRKTDNPFEGKKRDKQK